MKTLPNFCPYCGTKVLIHYDNGKIKCHECEKVFTVKLIEKKILPSPQIDKDVTLIKKTEVPAIRRTIATSYIKNGYTFN